ncbi:MAG: 3-methyl-2-oxobutanoate hydroxymethyltransferase [Pseudomonadota bacterium]
MNILDFQSRKAAGDNISMVTCYDFWSAQVLNQTDVDCLLVGDSLSMVMHGHESTVYADVELMALHVKAVAKGAPNKFVVGDMPFLATRKGLTPTMDAVAALMQSGANCVKIEGEAGQTDLMRHIVDAGVPVMGHLGLTPQSVEAFGGHKVQGRNEGSAHDILESAKRLEQAGVFCIVLECVPTELGRVISEQLTIPTIGIGAGPHTNGQVLVLQDMLGMNPSFKPKFLRHYGDGRGFITDAVNRFHDDTRSGAFPTKAESYA